MEEARMRNSIDSYARIAQLSPLFPILLWAAFAYGEILQNNFNLVPTTGMAASPSTHLKSTRSAHRAWFRIRWWLGGAVFSNYGTRIEWLFGISWASWLALLAVLDTNYGESNNHEVFSRRSTKELTDHVNHLDYLHFTKRVGAIGVSQLPLCLLLTMKTMSSPLQIALRISEQHLNSYHRILARTIAGFIACHVILYVSFFISHSLISKRIFDTDVIMGTTATLALVVIFITSLRSIRSRNYRLFFATHVLVGGLLFPVLYFHSRHLRVFLAESLVIYTINTLARYFNTKHLLANITCTPSNDVLVSLSLPDGAMEAAKYPTATYVYLSIPRQSRWLPEILQQTFIKNPFTIANSPSSKTLNLLIRPGNGPTSHFRSLNISEHSAVGMETMVPATIEGPYGLSAIFKPSFANHLRSEYDSVLFCAGGSGATFILPIVMAMLNSASASSPSQFFPTIQVLLIARTKIEADTILALFEDDDTNPQSVERAEASETRRRLRDVLYIFVTKPGYDMAEARDNRESLELAPLISEDHTVDTATQDSSGPSRNLTYGRPIWKEVLTKFFKQSTIHEKTAVLTCGPDGMRTQLRDNLNLFVRAGRMVWWCEEKFGH
jgi:hypothetical protein